PGSDCSFTDRRFQVRRLEPFTTPDTAWFTDGGECIEGGLDTPGGRSFRDDGVLPPQELVGGSFEVVDQPGPVDVRVIRGDDGSFATVGLFVDGVGPCQPGRTSDGVLRCLPERTGFPSARFADAECTEPLGQSDFSDPPCGLPGFIAETVFDDDENVGRRYRRVSGGYAGPTYTESEGNCGPAEDTGARWLRLAEDVPLSAFPTLVESTVPVSDAGEPVLELLAAGTEAAGPLLRIDLRALGEACLVVVPEAGEDEEGWCVPGRNLSDNVWGDPSCTEDRLHVLGDGDASADFYFDNQGTGARCLGIAGVFSGSVFRTVGPYMGDVYRGDASDCAGPVTLDGDPELLLLRSITPGELPRIHLVSEGS
ncbi:MAG TPA: hypothetical protein RMF84_21240, partial [Polyangiaceae bacterium LLY-WYZ-14_1]|nr:hypothetical protein [Polyangiaceae bacterium LLY-WYZ-14_1]